MRFMCWCAAWLLGSLLVGCGDPFSSSAAVFAYDVARENGEELTITGARASWGVTRFQTSTGFQSALHIQLVAEVGAGDNLLSSPVLFIDSQDDRLVGSHPEKGRYSIVATGEQFFRVTIGTSSGSYVADGGTVTITGSSSSTVEGSLDLHFRSENPAAIPSFHLEDPSAVTWAGGQVRGPRNLPVVFP